MLVHTMKTGLKYIGTYLLRLVFHTPAKKNRSPNHIKIINKGTDHKC